jgi:hypothetical protein
LNDFLVIFGVLIFQTFVFSLTQGYLLDAETCDWDDDWDDDGDGVHVFV